jgi:hypothetical protein
LSAPNGTITLNDTSASTPTPTADNGNETPTVHLSVTGNETATDNTVSSLVTAMGEITTIATPDKKNDDDDEEKKKSKEGGEQKKEDKKTDDDAKKYCN